MAASSTKPARWTHLATAIVTIAVLRIFDMVMWTDTQPAVPYTSTAGGRGGGDSEVATAIASAHYNSVLPRHAVDDAAVVSVAARALSDVKEAPVLAEKPPPEVATQALPAVQPVTAAASEAGPQHLVSTHRCYRMPPWGDVCVYSNLCLDGELFYYLDNDSPAALTARRYWACTCCGS